ncbi:unnamed protein product [Schistosoma margrebowiei]|uniref:Uncharacterized protein n=1 Tax=Schistosoma margrebowiei TaxID=48269 RepID=A0A183LJ89_9TREM|nr:unnamed protein product [Schistosoma margrebowiei]
MACVRSHPTLSFSVDINFKSLEDVGIYVETSVFEYKRKIVVGVTGSLNVLGLWNPEKALFCEQLIENMDENAVSLNLKILAWESRLKPREFTPTGNNFHLVSALDNLNTDKDTEIHMEFGVFGVTPNKPECSQKEDTLVYQTGSSTPKLSCLQYPSSSRTSYSSVVSRSYPVPMSTLEINRCRIHRGEQPECCGTLYKLGDDVTFFIETSDVENTSVEIQFYQQHLESSGNDTKISSSTPLKFIGSARFGPFVDTYGRKAAQILNSSLSPVGDLRGRSLGNTYNFNG